MAPRASGALTREAQVDGAGFTAAHVGSLDQLPHQRADNEFPVLSARPTPHATGAPVAASQQWPGGFLEANVAKDAAARVAESVVASSPAKPFRPPYGTASDVGRLSAHPPPPEALAGMLASPTYATTIAGYEPFATHTGTRERDARAAAPLPLYMQTPSSGARHVLPQPVLWTPFATEHTASAPPVSARKDTRAPYADGGAWDIN